MIGNIIIYIMKIEKGRINCYFFVRSILLYAKSLRKGGHFWYQRTARTHRFLLSTIVLRTYHHSNRIFFLYHFSSHWWIDLHRNAYLIQPIFLHHFFTFFHLHLSWYSQSIHLLYSNRLLLLWQLAVMKKQGNFYIF